MRICQRVIRGFLARKHLREGQAETIYPKMEAWSESWIQRFPRLPLFSPQPSPSKLESQLEGNGHKTAIQKFLSKSGLTHVNQRQFSKLFRSSLEDTLTFIMSLPPQERGYVIVVDEPQKSNSWMVSLALDQLSAHPPIDVVHKGELDRVLKNKNVRHVLLLDDASYSGKQIASNVGVSLIPCLEYYTHIKGIHFVIPFITAQAKETIAEATKDLYVQSCFLSSYRTMPMIGEFPLKKIGIDKNDLAEFEQFLLEEMGIAPEKSRRLALTYFDHKIADNLSVPDQVIKTVVGNIIPPYKEEFDKVLDQYAKQGPDSLRVDLLPEGDEFAERFVVIEKDGKYYVCTKLECEELQIHNRKKNIALNPLEMFELKEGDILITENAKFKFEGQKISQV